MKPQLDNQPESWAFFDKVYCISLKERPDRREKARQQFVEVGLGSRVEFVVVSKNRENPEKGIFESHQQCLRKGLASRAETILIFEDDVFFQRFSDDLLTTACNYLRSVASWDVLVLGGISSGSSTTPVRNLVRIRYRCLAHAYGVNKPFAQALVEKKWERTPWDEMLRLSGGRFYALFPMCAFQRKERSDNRTVVIDRTRRLFGGLAFIQWANELYQNHKLLAIFTPVLIVLLLGFVFFQML